MDVLQLFLGDLVSNRSGEVLDVLSPSFGIKETVQTVTLPFEGCRNL